MQPLIWLGILALLLVVEAITAGLTTIWFAGGALVAAIACYAGANLTVQILLFLCVWEYSGFITKSYVTTFRDSLQGLCSHFPQKSRPMEVFAQNRSHYKSFISSIMS